MSGYAPALPSQLLCLCDTLTPTFIRKSVRCGCMVRTRESGGRTFVLAVSLRGMRSE